MRIKVLLSLLILTVGIQLQAYPATMKKKILIAYFSHTGKTRAVAMQIKKITGADVFEIIPIKPYPNDYNTLLEQTKTEARNHYHPQLKTRLKNFNQYDIIIIGSPIWWFTFAPPVSSFLKSYNFENKTIVPFSTNEGSGLGTIVSDTKKLCPKVKILKGLSITGSKATKAQHQVSTWLKDIQIIK